MQLKTTNNLDLASAGITSSSQIQVQVEVPSTYQPITVTTAGQMTTPWTETAESGVSGESLISFTGQPVSTSWTRTAAPASLADASWPPLVADQDYQDMLMFNADDLSSLTGGIAPDSVSAEPSLQGLFVATNALAFTAPYFDTTSRSLKFTVSSPHYQQDEATVQSGSFEAFIPNGALETMWQIHPSAFVADMDGHGKGHSRVTPTVTVLPDGVLLTYSGFNYSTEGISIEPDTTPAVPPSGEEPAPAPAPTPSNPVAPTGTGDAFTNLVVTKDVDSSGSSISADAGDSHIQVQVPAGAFTTTQAITLTSGLASDAGAVFNHTDYSGYVPPATFGVNFSRDNPTVPITVTIQNADIPANAKVFKVNPDGTLQPVEAKVSKGVATITFSNDPDFVIAVPPTTPGNSGTGKGVMFNGVLQSVPSIVRYCTTYMPIWYLHKHWIS